MTVRIIPTMRPLLEHFARRLYANAGGPIKNGHASLRVMVRFLSGEKVTKAEAWQWLHARYEPGIKGLPSVSRVVKRQPREGFYGSEEWRDVRFQALKKADGCCALCGRSKRRHGVVLHVDHIKPRSRFPALELTLSNLQVLCEDCNLGKSNKDDTDWRGAA